MALFASRFYVDYVAFMENTCHSGVPTRLEGRSPADVVDPSDRKRNEIRHRYCSLLFPEPTE